MKVVVIGRGFGERVVAPVFASVPGCSVTAVVSPRDEPALDDALASGPDLVCVHAPPMAHQRCVNRALERGCRAVLCDKPFGRSHGEAVAMLEAAEQVRARHFVNFEFRWEPARRKVRELLASGAIGAVEHVVWTHHSSGSRRPLRPHGWLFDAASGGGWIGAWGSHAVDALRWMLDDEFTVDWSQPATIVAERPDAHGDPVRCTADDTVRAHLRARRTGATVTIDSTFVAARTVAPRLTVFGSDGSIENLGDRTVVLRNDGPTAQFDFTPPSGADPHLVAMQAWAQRLCRIVDSGADPSDAPTFVDGVRCAETLDRLRIPG